MSNGGSTRMKKQPAQRTRQVARLILMDAKNRILLLNGYGRVPEHAHDVSYWITPGGGVENGETYAQALVREAKEEIGLHIDVIGSWVWQDAFSIAFETVTIHFQSQYNFLRVQSHSVSTDGMTDSEQQTVRCYRWWTLDALRETDDILQPLNLADLLGELIKSDVPKQPRMLNRQSLV